MENKLNFTKFIIATICSFFISLVGGIDSLLEFLFLSIVVDLIIGTTKGFKTGEFKSAILKAGILNKLMEILIVAIFHKLDGVLGMQIFRNGSIIWFLICEGASIAENAIQLGLPVPDGMESIMQQLKRGVSVNFVDIAKKIIDEKVHNKEEK